MERLRWEVEWARYQPRQGRVAKPENLCYKHPVHVRPSFSPSQNYRMFRLILSPPGKQPGFFNFNPVWDYNLWSALSRCGNTEISNRPGVLPLPPPPFSLHEAGPSCPGLPALPRSRSARLELSSAPCRASLRLGNDWLNYSFSASNELWGDTFVVQSIRYKVDEDFVQKKIFL